MIDWADLTPAQVATLITSSRPVLDVGAELLNFDLTFARDLSGFVDVTGGDVQWQGSALVHRDVAINLSVELAWGIALVRVFRVVTDPMSGLSARRNRGVFCLTAPQRMLGQTVTGPDGDPELLWSVTGQDRTYLLDRQPGRSVQITLPCTISEALTQLYTAAGVPGYLVDSSQASVALPQPMVWPLVPSSTASSVDVQQGDPQIAANGSETSGATWRQMINDVHSLVGYRAVWADEDGVLRSTPYADPAGVNPTGPLDAASDVVSIIGMNRTQTQDLWAAPNRWVFLWSNMPNNGDGSQQAPTLGNGGIYVVDNVADGAASQQAREGLIYTSTVSLTAATLAAFTGQADTQVAADRRVITTYTATLTPAALILGHFDVLILNDPAVGDPRKVQCTSWTEHFTTDDIDITLESV